jgi:hypothetical protein
MTHDMNVLRTWILICVVLAAMGATAVPIIYSFSPWRSRRLGQIFMLKAVSFAAALDMTVVFAFWTPHNILIEFWVEAIVFSAIAVSTSAQAFLIWQLRRKNARERGRKSD